MADDLIWVWAEAGRAFWCGSSRSARIIATARGENILTRSVSREAEGYHENDSGVALSSLLVTLHWLPRKINILLIHISAVTADVVRAARSGSLGSVEIILPFPHDDRSCVAPAGLLG
jgi:hypothetical protein